MPDVAPKKIAIVAALKREVAPLVRDWRTREREHDGRKFSFFEHDGVTLICGGIGALAARRAAEAAIALFRPDQVLSVGFAGALDSQLKVGDVIRPQVVINAGDGSRTLAMPGEGVLVSWGAVASPAQKIKLRDSFGAHAVDMEAAAVARAAEVRGVAFGAVKAISDEIDFEFPATERFIDADGQFSEARFGFYAALRPWLWPQVIRLAGNSKRASRALCAYLRTVSTRGESNPLPNIKSKPI